MNNRTKARMKVWIAFTYLLLFACGFALGRESVFWQIKHAWSDWLSDDKEATE